MPRKLESVYHVINYLAHRPGLEGRNVIDLQGLVRFVLRSLFTSTKYKD